MKENLCNNNVRVFVRIRPFKQSQNKNQSCIISHNQEGSIVMKDRQSASNFQFTFDKILPPSATQQEVYTIVASNVIQNGLEGINGTIFAYGQTSSGKTHTCIGPNYDDQEQKGILPRMISEILKRGQNKPDTLEYRVKLSMVEIYNQKVKDLLEISKDNLKIRSNKSRGIYIENVTQKVLTSMQEAQNLLKKGIENRAVGCTNMNAQSSRSHMVFLISIYQNNFLEGQAKSAKITLIDLAGSQKISKTGAQGKLLQQAKQINKSLSALGKVINTLSDAKNKNVHIPYRDSKLTRLLQESLGGNSLTSLIVNVSPSSYNENQTMSSLRFGYRAKSIENKPKVNKQYTIQQLTKMLERAQKKVRDQQKVIESFQKKKRVGGYGCFSGSSVITMHVIGSQSQSQSDQQKKSIKHSTSNCVREPEIGQAKNSLKDLVSALSIKDHFREAEDQEITKVQPNIRISIQQNSQNSMQDQMSQLNQNSTSRRGILQNLSIPDLNVEARLSSKSNQCNKLRQQNHQTKRNQRKKSSRVRIQDKQSIYEIRNQGTLTSLTRFQNYQLIQGQELKEEKNSTSEEVTVNERQKYADLLVNYSNLRSQNSMHKMMIGRKNQVIESLKARLKEFEKQIS